MFYSNSFIQIIQSGPFTFLFWLTVDVSRRDTWYGSDNENNYDDDGIVDNDDDDVRLFHREFMQVYDNFI